MSALVKVTHRFFQQGGHEGLASQRVRLTTNEVWVNTAQIVLIVSEGDFFTMSISGASKPITIDATDLARLLAEMHVP